jgi:hypothetical protein
MGDSLDVCDDEDRYCPAVGIIEISAVVSKYVTDVEPDVIAFWPDVLDLDLFPEKMVVSVIEPEVEALYRSLRSSYRAAKASLARFYLLLASGWIESDIYFAEIKGHFIFPLRMRSSGTLRTLRSIRAKRYHIQLGRSRPNT